MTKATTHKTGLKQASMTNKNVNFIICLKLIILISFKNQIISFFKYTKFT